MKPKRSKSGRNKFGAGKRAGSDKGLSENLQLAGIGEIAEDKTASSAFEIVAIWKTHYRQLLIGPCPESAVAAERWGNRRECLLRRLADILDPAFSELDTQPILQLAKAVEAVRRVNERKLCSPIEHAALLVARENGLLATTTEPRVTWREFVERVGKPGDRQPNERHLRRVAKKYALTFKPGKPGRPRNQ